MTMNHDACRVLRVITRLNIGGPANEIRPLCRLASDHGFQTVLAAGKADTNEGDLFDSMEVPGGGKVRIRGLGRSPGVWTEMKAIASLRGLIRDFRPHVVHTHTSKAGALGRLVARVLRVPVICHTFHGHVLEGYFSPLVSATLVRTESLLARLTDVVFVLGPRNRADLIRLGIGRRVEMIPPGFDLKRLRALGQERAPDCRKHLGVPDGSPVLLALGRLASVKGIDVLLEALERLKCQDVRPHLLVVGDGPRRSSLEALADDLGLQTRVRFLGWKADIREVLGAADLLVLPSRNEGYPHAVIEAMAAGIPVIASAVGEVPELVEDGATGFLVPPDDPDALASRIRSVVSDPDILNALGKAATGILSRCHREEDMVARTCAMYRGLLAEKEREMEA